jgi:hypothetical protein
MEEDNNISYLGISIHRSSHSLQIGIYRNPTQAVTTIHFTSKLRLEHKPAPYRFYINTMLFTPITDEARQQEWDTIRIIPKINGFPLRIIHNLKYKLMKTQKNDNTHKHTTEKVFLWL